MLTEMELTLEQTQQEHAEFDESNTNVLERFYTSAGNPVKEILLKLNLPDHRSILMDSKILKDGGEVKEFQRSFRHSDTERLSRSDEVLKLKKFKKDETLKLFKSTNQERYEHVGLEVTRWQSLQDGEMRLCLVDDLKVFKITYSHTSQDKGTSSNLKSNITTSYSQDKKKKEVCEHKNEDLHSMIDSWAAKWFCLIYSACVQIFMLLDDEWISDSSSNDLVTMWLWEEGDLRFVTL
ncbi:hypothetical protein Tco_0511923 [Tanacetum coccineum]